MIEDFEAFKGLNNEVLIEGPGVATIDLDDYDEIRFSADGGSIVKGTSDAAEAEKQNSGKDLLVHLLVADLSGYDDVADLRCQLHYKSGSDWFALTSVGTMKVRVSA